jgi:hypothetical protein
MFDVLTKATNGFRTIVQLFAYILLGVMMTLFVGLPLAIGGRPEAIIPLGLGGMALFNGYKTIMQIVRARPF